MLLEADDEIWVGADDYWVSRVISPALLDAARGDRSLWADMGPRIAGFDSNALVGARAWAAAERVAMLHQGTGELGLPAEAVASVAKALGPLVLRPPESIDVLIEALKTTAIAIAVEAIAAIPVVGPIARAIGSMAMMLRGLASKPQEHAKDYLPPPHAYSRNAEEYVMNTQLLPTLTTSDWTGLFLPRVGNHPQLVELESGWMLGATDSGAGLGFIPGTQQINSATQAFWHKKSSRAGGSQATHQDIGDFYPGPAQLMTAIDQQVQRPGPELWSVSPAKIRRAWRDHLDATMSFAYDLYFGRGIKGTGLDKLNEEQRRLIVQQLVAPLHVSMVGGELRRGMLAANAWTPKRPPDDIGEAFVDPWCDRLEKRQSFYLETIAVAYADPGSAAFEHSPKLRDKLEHMRALLLESPARHHVDQRDVIDPDYRAALFDSTVGDQLKAPTGKPKVPPRLQDDAPEPEPPKPPQGGAPFDPTIAGSSGSGGGGGLVLGLGTIGLVWALRRLKRRR